VPRIVHKGHANGPARSRGQSVKANRTTRNEPRKMDRPRRPGGPSARDPDRPLLKLGPSANQLQRKPKTQPDQNKNTKNITTNWDELPPRGQSASSNRTGKARAHEVNSTYSSPDLPNGRSWRDKGLRTRYASNKDAIPPKISPPNSLKHRESRILCTPHKTRAPTENP
jgi:hypothetical protein